MPPLISVAPAESGPALTDYGNGMTDINPSDIKSITVLKGTAASSLYGSLGKNGVIIVTTKKGSPGNLPSIWRVRSMDRLSVNYLMSKNNLVRVGEVFRHYPEW
jgi:TonB-dependent SusC/RagA subfamily outer membrane receptor